MIFSWMEAFETKWSGIQDRLGTRINGLNSFVKYLKIQSSKAKEFGEIEEARGHLKFLKDIFKNDYLTGRSFGLEVFLNELDDLFSNSIDSLKISMDTFFNNPSSVNFANVNQSLSYFNLNLKKCSFIEIMGKRIRSVTEFLSTDISFDISNDSFDILDRYLDVGETLKNDEVTERLLEQIAKLHTEANPI